MIKKIQLAIPYLREDGKYLGGLHNEEFRKGEQAKLTIPDNNNLEHILHATIVESIQTTEGAYSLLLELNPPAPQRVIDMEWFRKMKFFSVGSVEYEQLKVYCDIVLIVGEKFIKGTHEIDTGRKINIIGTVISEETKLIPEAKYAFTIKLDKPLSEEDYKFLKSIEIE